MEPKDRIIVALDVKDPNEAAELVEVLYPHVGGFKVGLEFITSTYTSLMTMSMKDATFFLQDLRVLYETMKGKLFWDGKWADIPNTVAGAAQGIQFLTPKYINVHASAGNKAIAAAVQNKGTSKVLGVTVLTSIDEEECQSIFGTTPGFAVLYFARTLLANKADGIICSPQELEILTLDGEFSEMEKITPGVRPEWADKGDQRRVMRPGEAIKAGATGLVIGRPITQPPEKIGSPVEAAKRIAEEISMALAV